MNHLHYYAFADELEKIARAGLFTRVSRAVLPGRAAAAEAAAAEGARAAAAARGGAPAYSVGDDLLNVMRSSDDIALSGQRGIHSLGTQPHSLQQTIEASEAAARSGVAREAQMASKIEEAMRSGAFNPKQHSVAEFMRSGNIVAKKPVTSAPQWRPEGTSAGAAVAPGPAVNVRPPPMTGPAPRMPGAQPAGGTVPHAPAPQQTQLARPVTQAPATAPAPATTPAATPPASGTTSWAPMAKRIGTGATLVGAGGLGGYALS